MRRYLIGMAGAVLSMAMAAGAWAQPVFISASARVAKDADAKAKAAAIQSAVDQVKKNVGDKVVKCYIVAENLSAGEQINEAMKKLAGNTPWEGLGTNWPEYPPINRDTLGEAEQKTLGIAITAVCGDVDVELEMVEGLTKTDVSYDLSKERQAAAWEVQKPLHAAKGAELVKKFSFPAGDGITDVLMYAGSMHTPRQELVYSGMKEALPAGVKLIGGAGSDFSTLYYNGKTFSNGLIGLRISGKFQAVYTGSKGGKTSDVSLGEHLKTLTEQLGGTKPTGLIYFGCLSWNNHLPGQQKALQQYLPDGVGVYGNYCGGEIGVLKTGPEPVAGTGMGVLMLFAPAK